MASGSHINVCQRSQTREQLFVDVSEEDGEEPEYMSCWRHIALGQSALGAAAPLSAAYLVRVLCITPFRERVCVKPSTRHLHFGNLRLAGRHPSSLQYVQTQPPHVLITFGSGLAW